MYKNRLKRNLIAIFNLLLVIFAINIVNTNHMLTGDNITLEQQEIVIKLKTLDSITTSWEDMDIPQNITKYKVYKDGILIKETTDKFFSYTNLVYNQSYNFKTEFLDNENNLITSKELNNIKVAQKITSILDNKIYEKDTYYIQNHIIIPAGKKVVFESGSIIKISDTRTITVNGELELNGTVKENVLVTSTADNVKWKSIEVKAGGNLKINNTVIEKRWSRICRI